MPTVPQPYSYAIASIPGTAVSGFTGQMSDHLIGMIRGYIPAGTNPVVNSDGFNVIVGFDVDLSEDDKAVLDGLIPRASEYLVVTYGNGDALDIDAEGPTASLLANGIDTKALRVQLKNGDGSDSTGHGEVVRLSPASLIPIDTVEGTLNGSGQLSFNLQTSNFRGDVAVNVVGQYTMPVFTFFAEWA